MANEHHDLQWVRERMLHGIPPATAEEYLLRVRLEAESLSPVIVAKGRRDDDQPSPVLSPSFEEEIPVDSDSDDWERRSAAIFRQALQYVDEAAHSFDSDRAHKLPSLHDGYAWHFYCFGTRLPQDCGESHGQQGTGANGHPPLVSVLTKLDSRKAYRLLNKHVQWLETAPLTKARSLWLYALMLRIEQPLNGDSASLLRKLARRCMQYESMAANDRIVLCCARVLLTVISKHFKQMRML